MMQIIDQFWAAITRAKYPAASVHKLGDWAWDWNGSGNVKYKHWTILWRVILRKMRIK